MYMDGRDRLPTAERNAKPAFEHEGMVVDAVRGMGGG
jgi:hypothetical protein